MTEIIKVTNLAFAYPHQDQLFRQVSFTLHPGDVLTLLGPNGVGKSTLLKCLTGQSQPSAGTITLAQGTLNTLTTRQLAHQLALVPQDYRVNADLTVLEYVLTGRAPFHFAFGAPNQRDQQIANAQLNRLNIAALAHRPIRQLSGGQAQLAAIARALAQEPRCLILDEPMAALDLGHQQALLGLIRHLSQSGMAIILTTHTPNHALILGGQTGLFAPNGDFTVGPTDQVITTEHLTATYQANLRVFYSATLGRKVCEPI